MITKKELTAVIRTQTPFTAWARCNQYAVEHALKRDLTINEQTELDRGVKKSFHDFIMPNIALYINKRGMTSVKGFAIMLSICLESAKNTL